MKRTVTLTAAALMFAGMTSLSLANENSTVNKPAPSVSGQPAASPPSVEAKPVANVESGKQPAAMSSKSEAVPSKEGTAPSEKVVQSSPTVTEKTEKKETSANMTSEVKDKKTEQKPSETPAATHPTK